MKLEVQELKTKTIALSLEHENVYYIMAKLKANQTTIMVAIVAVLGVAIALYGFHRSSKDKTQRAMWSESAYPSPASEYLTYVDLGGVGDDLRYTINNPSGVAGIKYSSAREGGDPNWLDTQFKADAMHGTSGVGPDHTPIQEFLITTPEPISLKPIVVSAPNGGSNHETVGGNFLNKNRYPGTIP